MFTTPRLRIEYGQHTFLYTLTTFLLTTFCSGTYLHRQSLGELECYEGYSAIYDIYFPKTCRPTIAILAEQPYSMAKTTASVPLLVVPQDSLELVQDVPTHPVFTLESSTSTEQLHGMIPAVRVFLRSPMMVSSPESVISFPSGFTVVHDEIAVLLAVSAVIAPLPSGTYVRSGHPIAIRVVYALSVSPLRVQDPLHHSLPNRKPVSVASPVVSTSPAPVTPVSEVTPSLPSRPQQTIPQYPTSDDSNLVMEGVHPGEELVVTVLDFPVAVASPSVSFFPQLSLDEDSGDLGNREPPQAAVPAGIIQSTAPLPNLSVFVNSKESSVLQTLRDEAQRNKTQQQEAGSISNTPSMFEILKN